jgi:sugar phosphate isomerase/epimerase
MEKPNRRAFLSSLLGLPVIASAGLFSQSVPEKDFSGSKRLKTSLNAYSFNAPLTNGSMHIDDMLRFCSTTGFEGVDITGYYFKGYPAVPSDDYIFHTKRKAFELGLEISGTGVRNDFTIADKAKRQLEVELVKKWIEVAAKLGAPVIRVFAGNQKNDGYTKEQVTEWLLEDLRTCVSTGKQHGVIVGLQNHNDFIQTADEINRIIEAINSDWLGIILDTGSYRVHNPYEEIAKSIKHTVNWQIKEKLFVNGAEVETDMSKLMAIIKASDYRGYLPIETLGEGDPKIKITALLQKLKQTME